MALRHVSKKPSKARKRQLEAPLHTKSSWVRAPISRELREKYRFRNVRVREGDTIKILRGEFKGVEGKVTRVFTDSGRLAIDGVTRPKIRGGTTPVKMHSSKVVVTALNLEDSNRKKKLEAKGGTA